MTTDLSISRGSIESAKKALENDLKAVVSDAGKLLNEVGNYTVEEFAAARSRVEARYDEAGSSLHSGPNTPPRQHNNMCATTPGKPSVSSPVWR